MMSLFGSRLLRPVKEISCIKLIFEIQWFPQSWNSSRFPLGCCLPSICFQGLFHTDPAECHKSVCLRCSVQGYGFSSSVLSAHSSEAGHKSSLRSRRGWKGIERERLGINEAYGKSLSEKCGSPHSVVLHPLSKRISAGYVASPTVVCSPSLLKNKGWLAVVSSLEGGKKKRRVVGAGFFFRNRLTA